jgi:hypothetical protein
MTQPANHRSSKLEETATTAVAWLLAALFAFFGATKLAGADAQVARFEAWGYPLWFMYVVGATEVASALALLSRRTAFYGAAALVGLMIGGAATHLVAGEVMQAPLPIVTAAAAGLVALLRRPAWLSVPRRENATTEVGDGP